ncbi:hypothetical protein [Rhodopila sp.]|uniref:hypothetical protein n=1 Tax=Rhodopila sp. TaxID=2480087 RepID=UPI003D0F4F59
MPDRNHVSSKLSSKASPNWAEALFHSAVVNSLEMPNGGFHYSVIGGNVSGLLACGAVVRRPYDKVAALGRKIIAPDPDAVRLFPRGHGLPAMNDASTHYVSAATSSRRKKE